MKIFKWILGLFAAIGGILAMMLIPAGGKRKRIKALDKKMNSCFSESKEETMNAKNSRVAIRKDFDRKIDKLDKEMKTTKQEFSNEIKVVNSAISEVKSDTAEIKGMLNTLLNKK